MFTPDGPRVLEYNVRFGDPECQPLLMRLDGDLLEIMLACTRGTLERTPVRWKPQSALCVVMAAGGYPKSYPKGMEITGIEAAEARTGVTVFQAGTSARDGRTLCSGGRVLGVTALGDTLAQARDAAYRGVELIHFDPCHYRRDIGSKGLGRK
jgi:phosphoribosylamine--glycine ligase